MAKTTAGLALLVMSLVMAGCGSSDSTSEDTGFAFYRGSERPAVLSRDNAGVMLANVLKANRSVIADFGTFPVDPAIALPASDDDEADDPMSMLLRHTRRQGEDVMQRVRRAAPPIEISEVQAMSCETGSVEISVVVNANGTGSASLTYYDCENLGYVYSGEAFISVLAYDQTLDFPSRMRFDFRSLRYRDANSSWRIDGSIESVRELGQHVDTLLIPEVTVQNESSGWMYMAKDFRARVRYNALLYDAGGEVSLEGRLYESSLGYVDFSTPVPMTFERVAAPLGISGMLEFGGYGGVRVEMFNSTHVRLFLDVDGSGWPEAVAVVDWESLIRGASLVDTDGDNMHDDYELQMGMSPYFGLDALLDFDGDGFPNFIEYLAATDPWNPRSF